MEDLVNASRWEIFLRERDALLRSERTLHQKKLCMQCISMNLRTNALVLRIWQPYRAIRLHTYSLGELRSAAQYALIPLSSKGTTTLVEARAFTRSNTPCTGQTGDPFGILGVLALQLDPVPPILLPFAPAS